MGIRTGLGGFDKEMRNLCVRIVAKTVYHFAEPRE